MKVVTQTT